MHKHMKLVSIGNSDWSCKSVLLIEEMNKLSPLLLISKIGVAKFRIVV